MWKRSSSREGLFSSSVITMIQIIYTSFQSLAQAVAQVLYYHWLEGKFKEAREKYLEIRVNIVGFILDTMTFECLPPPGLLIKDRNTPCTQ